MQSIGEVELKFTSKNVVTLTNVLFVQKVRKNLVSGNLLSKFNFRLVMRLTNLSYPRVVLFVGKGCLCHGMLKLNVLAISNKNDAISSYLIKSSFSLWHNRPDHVN